MSFFEKMMKLNQNNQHHTETLRQSLYQEQQTAPNQQRPLYAEHPKPKTMLRDFSLRSSLSLKPEELQESDQGEDVFQEPSIEPVYVHAKPVLFHHLLPKKEQMMRDMLAKKKEFQLRKKNLCSQKKNIMLESKVQEVSQKIKNSELISLNGNKNSSQKSDKMKASSVRGMSDNKPKKLAVNLGQSMFSASLHTQMIASPTADAFNKEIMLKLLNIIQKDRQTVQAPQQNYRLKQSSAKKTHKDAPIIINNIMKTPMDNINRDLIEREMKIKMLQNDRSNKQYSRGSESKPKSKHSFNGSQLMKDNVSNCDIAMTDRSNGRPSVGGLSVTTHINKSNKKEQVKRVNKTEDKNEFLMAQQEELLRQISFDNVAEEQSKAIEPKHDDSTKNNSHQNSMIVENVGNKKSCRPRDFKKNRVNTHKEENVFSKIQTNPNEKNETQQTKPEPIKPPVRLDIPFEDQKQTEGMTLAEAFKKRVGRLQSQQKRAERLNSKSPMLKGTSNLQSFPSQMAITISDKFTEYNNSDIDYSAPVTGKNIKINIDNSLTNRSIPSKLKDKQNSLKKLPKEDKCAGKKMSQPSKQLMDRLIYGQKAKISKEEMYALTKKNYNNLPEVQAKRKEEEKRKAQQERINKAKQYQKAIRSGKSSNKQLRS